MSEGPISSESSSRRRVVLAVLAALALEAAVVAFLWVGLPGTLGFVDASAKLWQAKSIADGHVVLTRPADNLDPDGAYIPDYYVVRIDGQPVTTYLNVFCVLAGLAWRLVGPWALNLLPMVSALATLLIVLVFARRENLLPENDLWLLVPVLWLCTPMLVYSVLPLEHILAGVFASAAMLFACREVTTHHPRRWTGLVRVGAFLGLAALTRGECYLLAPAMAVMVLWLVRRDGRRAVLTSAASMILGGSIILFAWFANVPGAFTVQRGLAEASYKTPMDILARLWHYLFYVHPGHAVTTLIGERAADAVSIVAGVSLVAAVVLGLASGVRRSWLRHAATAAFVIALAATQACWRTEGLFLVCPVIVLAAFLVRSKGAFTHPATTLVVGTSAGFGLLLWVLVPNAGASQFGPRFLIPVVVPLAAVVFAAVRRHRTETPGSWLTAMLLVALAAGLLTELKGLVQYRRAARLAAETERTLETLPAPFVVFPPSEDGRNFHIYRAPTVLTTKPVLHAKDDAQLAEIVKLLRDRGIRRFTVICLDAHTDAKRDLLRSYGLDVVETHVLPYEGRALIADTSE